MNKSINRDLFWNTAGSLIYALSSMILAFFVMRVAGASDGGIFGFGFSTFGQQMFIVAYFGIRPFQITDVSNEYSFGEYRRARILSSLVAVFISSIFLSVLFFSGEYSAYKSMVIMLLALSKTADGFADVYESECQRAGKLYLGGKALFLRTIFVMAVFMAALWLTESLLTAAVCGVAAQLIGFFSFNVRFFGECRENISTVVKKGKCLKIFKDTALLFVSVFLDFYVFSSVKYAIDLSAGSEASGIFNVLFMPTSFVYLVANFIIKPFMTTLASAYELKDYGKFSEISKKIKLVIAGLIVVCVLLAFILGGPVLKLGELILGGEYAGSLYPHRYAFAVIIAGGGFYAMANFYYYLLVIMRKQKSIFAVYLITAVIALILSDLAVSGFGIEGAAAGYCILMIILMISFCVLSSWGAKDGYERRD